jgi:dTDP-4-amino-4,6-dideoxygalactose transaminase
MDCIDHIISLPMHPYLSQTDQDKVVETAKAVLANG